MIKCDDTIQEIETWLKRIFSIAAFNMQHSKKQNEKKR